MIQLERHIEILLLKNDCIIVPGLGGFVASHVSARYDENDNMFIPPFRTLGFNPKLNINDSLLAQSYTETYDISYPEACVRIESEVNELKQHIANNGSYELNDIGTLWLNDNGNIEFTPCEAGILTPNLYSLSSFEMKKNINSFSPEHEQANDSTVVPVAEFSVRKSNGIQSIPNTDISINDKKDGKSDRIQIRISAIRNLVAAVIAVLLFFALGTPVNESGNNLQTSNIGGGLVDKLINAGYDSAENKQDLDFKKDISSKKENDKDAFQDSTGETAITNINKQDSNYFSLVLASQVTEKNAIAFVEKLKREGISQASVLKEKGKSIKVIYGHYPNKSEAYNALNELRGKELFYDSWVYQIKN